MEIPNEQAELPRIQKKDSKTFRVIIAIISILLLLTANLLFIKTFKQKSNVAEKKLADLEYDRDAWVKKYNNLATGSSESTHNTTSELYCPNSSKENITTKDGKYYLYRAVGLYKICDQSDPKSPKVIEYYESRIQNGYILVITVYGDQMFIADLKNKTLNYIDILDFAEKDRYYNNDSTPDLFLFGPKEEDLNSFSPMKDKLIFGASDCHDCDTIVKSYVLNLNTYKITELGYTSGSVRWLNNSTVEWVEVTSRDRTEEEVAKDPYGFPVVVESLGTKTKTFE